MWEKGAAAPLSHTLSPRSYNQNPTPQIYLILREKWSKEWGAPNEMKLLCNEIV